MKNLKTILKNQGRTQYWLAKQLGVSEMTISLWSRGKHSPSYASVFYIAHLLDVSPSVFKNGVAVKRTHRRCANCHQVKPIEGFGRGYCKECAKPTLAAIKRRHNKRHPARAMARNKITDLLARGKISPNSQCADCGNNNKIEAHHENYAKPLEVTWLCRKCHLARHAGEPARGTSCASSKTQASKQQRERWGVSPRKVDR